VFGHDLETWYWRILQLPPSRWRTSDMCTEACQPAGSLKVTRVIDLEKARSSQARPSTSTAGQSADP
jgi:hypothetical protein